MGLRDGILLTVYGEDRTYPVFLKATVQGFSWGLFTSGVLALDPFDIIIGADLFYDNTKGMDSI